MFLKSNKQIENDDFREALLNSKSLFDRGKTEKASFDALLTRV